MNDKKVVINGIVCNNYTVSPDGTVYSLLYNKCLKYAVYSGYHAVPIVCNGKSKRCYVHRLVASVYLPNPDKLPEVNHKDGDKGNNCVENLEWVTRSEQMKHACSTGLRKTHMRPVVQYDLEDTKIAEFKSAQAASDATSIPRCDISSVCRGKTVSCRGFRFCYKEDEDKPKPWDRKRQVSRVDPKTGLTIEKFDTVKDAAVCAGVATNFMVKCCNKHDYVHEGYLWRYTDDTSPVEVTRDFDKEKYERIKINGEEVDGYFVCPDGRVWSEKQKRYLTSCKAGAYGSLGITHNGKQINVRSHKEVAKAYIDNTAGNPIVNHKDGIKRNNDVTNLEWCTYSQNTKHAHDTGLINKYTRPVVKYSLQCERICDYDSVTDAAKDVGVNHTSISAALSGETKTSGGYIWKYKDDKTKPEQVAPNVVRTRSVLRCSETGDLLQEYNSVKDAAKHMDVNHTSIVNACTGKSNTCAGFYWKYKDPSATQKTPKLEENKEFKPSTIQFSGTKKVVKYDLDINPLQTYNSVKDAALAHNTTSLNISRACRGEIKNFGGFVWMFEGAEFITIKTRDDHPLTKEVVQFDLSGAKIAEYQSRKEAADSVGLSISKITDACAGKSKTSGGFIWKYKCDCADDIKTETLPVSDSKLRKVVKFDLQCNKLREYDSIKEAAEDTGIKPGGISSACVGKIETSGDFIWRYKEDEDTVKPKTIKLRKNQRGVVQYDLQGKKIAEFIMIKDASVKTGFHANGIANCCNGKLESSHGFVWKFKGDKFTMKSKTVSVRAKRVAKYDKDTGEKLEEYESATAAAKDVGTEATSISAVCNGNQKTCKGYVWKHA